MKERVFTFKASLNSNYNNISQSVRQTVGAWPVCVSESDQHPVWSPCTMGSGALTPRASVPSTAGRIKRRASAQEHDALAVVRGGIDVSFVMFWQLGCVKWCMATEMDVNRLSLRFGDKAGLRICCCICEDCAASPQTKMTLLPSYYSCKSLLWRGKHCCRWERIDVLISVIFIHRSLYMNKEQASPWEGNSGLKSSLLIQWPSWRCTMLDLSAARLGSILSDACGSFIYSIYLFVFWMFFLCVVALALGSLLHYFVPAVLSWLF